jgi:Tol biopolymer transport system component
LTFVNIRPMSRKLAKVLVPKFSLSAAIGLAAILAGATAAYCGMFANAPSLDAPRVSITQITHDGQSKTGLLSDDSNLYVTESPAARHVVAKTPLQGSQRQLISSPFSNFQALDVSADGKMLLVSTTAPGSAGDSEFWTLPLGSGSPQRVGNLTGRDAAWSNDGKNLIFTKSASLYFANANGSDVRELYSGTGSLFSPRFSLDGRVVRFTVGDAAQNTTALWEVGRDGSNPHPLLADWANASAACCGRWTGDGRYYIFQVTQTTPATITTLWALPASSLRGSPIQLTSGPMSLGNVSPTRDSNRVLAIGVAPSAEAVRYDSAKKSFMPVLNGVSATDLDFSADGKWATYVAIPDGTLWRCRADGSDRLQLTNDRAALPHWSPDSQQISYVDVAPGKPSRILLISRDGGSPREMFAEDQGQIDANWSADGSSIMYGYFWNDQKMSIRVANLKTHQVTTVPGSEGLFSPRWSPNGQYIAALSPDFTKVMIFDFATQKWTNWFTEPAGAVSYPVWSADSKYIYFDDLVTDEESIRRVKVGERQPESVFVLRGIERYPGQFGLWLGRTTDGSWMFVRDRSTQEVYQLTMELP